MIVCDDVILPYKMTGRVKTLPYKYADILQSEEECL